MPKTSSPITELERMIDKRRAAQATIKSVETAPNDWLRELPSAGEVPNGVNGRTVHHENGDGNANH
jgi:hypothetical protein